MTKPKTPYKPSLEQLIRAGQRKKQAYLVRWGLLDQGIVTQVELDYWMLFVTGLYGGRKQRMDDFINSYNVRGKIDDLKKAGKWPPQPQKNQDLIELFRMAYKDQWPY
jgi:hypothetical protein